MSRLQFFFLCFERCLIVLTYFIVLSLNNMVLHNTDCNLGQIDFEAVQNEV